MFEIEVHVNYNFFTKEKKKTNVNKITFFIYKCYLFYFCTRTIPHFKICIKSVLHNALRSMISMQKTTTTRWHFLYYCYYYNFFFLLLKIKLYILNCMKELQMAVITTNRVQLVTYSIRRLFFKKLNHLSFKSILLFQNS